MSGALSPLQEALLRCCTDPEGEHGGLAELLGAASPGEAAYLFELTRIGPLAEFCLARAAAEPPAMAVQLARLSRRQTLHALSQARGLVRAAGLLRDAGIECIALKGAALAFRDYPAPQLRPLRDIDLLVRPDEAEAAQALLLSHPGYRKPAWAGPYGIDYGHQLPEIEDQDNAVVIEIHHRLNARGWAGEPHLLEAMWCSDETIELLGTTVRVPTTQANLLHLIEHATLHHGFSNGPLVLADLHFIATRAQPDWDAISHAAARMGLTRAMILVAQIARQFGARWVPPALAQRAQSAAPYAPAAAAAMFAGREQVEAHDQLQRLRRRAEGKSGVLAALSRISRPERHQLARFSGQSPASPLRWIGYPAWLMAKGGRYWRSRRDPAFLAEHRRRAAMLDWLAQPD